MSADEARVIVQELASVCRGAWSAARLQVFRGVLVESRLEAKVARHAVHRLLQELPPDDITPSEIVRLGRKLTIPRIAVEDHRESGIPVPQEAALKLLRAIRAPLERKFSLPTDLDRGALPPESPQDAISGADGEHGSNPPPIAPQIASRRGVPHVR